MAASIPPASEREPPDSPHVLAVSECEDRLEVQARVVRRHFWRRLLPGVGVMSRALEFELALLTGRAPGFGQTSRERPQGSA